MNIPTPAPRHLIAIGALCLTVAACAGSAAVTVAPPSLTRASAAASPTAFPGSSAAAFEAGTSSSSVGPASASPSGSAAPDTSGPPTVGDIPDNAVFLTHKSSSGFTIQYVEGWQVTTRSDGVDIHDKDSSETVKLVQPPKDVATYVTSTDLPALQAHAGFKLIKQDTVKVGSATLQHLAYHIPSQPDAVTGKQVPLTVDRYYVVGPNWLAVVTLSSPDGVDNVDAFRQMIESFMWQ